MNLPRQRRGWQLLRLDERIRLSIVGSVVHNCHRRDIQQQENFYSKLISSGRSSSSFKLNFMLFYVQWPDKTAFCTLSLWRFRNYELIINIPSVHHQPTVFATSVYSSSDCECSLSSNFFPELQSINSCKSITSEDVIETYLQSKLLVGSWNC